MYGGDSSPPSRLPRGNVGIPHAGKQRQRRCIRRPFGFSPPTHGKPRRVLDTASGHAVPAGFHHFQRPFRFPAKAPWTASGSPESGGRTKAACCRASHLRPFGLCRAGDAESLKGLENKHIVAGRRPPLRGPARFDRKGTKQQWHLCTHSAAA